MGMWSGGSPAGYGGGGGGGYGGGGDREYGRRGGGGRSRGGGGRGGGPESRPGDWECPDCTATVFASKYECFKCGCPKPENPKPAASFDRGGGGRPGDWECPECASNVFGSKYECFRCGCPKPENARPAASFDRGGGRPGDWECPECTATVFGSKYECFRCGCPKPENARPAQASGGRDGGSWGAGGRERGRGRDAPQEPWQRAEDDTNEIDEAVILNLIQTRDVARADRDYPTADDIRELLREDWSVQLDDGLREWWVGEPRSNLERGGQAMVWARLPGDEEEVDEEQVMEMITQRDVARKARDFGTADELRESLQRQFSVAVDDGMRQWWVGGPRDNRGGGKFRGPGAWARSPDDTAEVDEDLVMGLIQTRDEARRSRDFNTADAVRDTLQNDWGVAVDDDLKEWWVGERKDNRDRKFGGRGDRGGGRGDRMGGGRRAFAEPFRRSEDDTAEVDEVEVGSILRQREDARKDRDYRTADDLRDTLQQEFGVTVDDDEREWWVGERKGNRVRKFNDLRGDRPPPGTWGADRRGGGGGRRGGGGGRRGGGGRSGGGWRDGGGGGNDNYGWD